MPSLWDVYLKVPPVTRFLCVSTLAVTLPVILESLSPRWLVFVKRLVFKNLEVWRLFTSMFYAGGGIMFIFTFVMLYIYSNGLETRYYSRRSADYAWQVLVNCCTITALNLPLDSSLRFRALIVSLITVDSGLAPSKIVSIFGLAAFPNKYFPYALVMLELILYGPSAAACVLTGLISGYAWWYFVHSEEAGRPGAAFAIAPYWMHRLFTRHDWGRGRRLG